MKTILILVLFLTFTPEFINAQGIEVGVSYSLLGDNSNVGNINIVNYSNNERLEINILTKNWYSHIGIESLSFSENAVISNSALNHISYINNPGNLYDLKFLNISLGWRSKPYGWLNLISGISSGFLIDHNISFNDDLKTNGYIVNPLNNLYEKSEALEKIRLNVFLTMELEYHLRNPISLVFSYKFEVPLLPLVSNSEALPYFTLSNEASETYLQFINIGFRYRFK